MKKLVECHPSSLFQKPRGRGAGSANNNNSLTTPGQTSTTLNTKNDNSSAITKMDTSPIPSGNRNINVSKLFILGQSY